MSRKVYVGNLAFEVENADLERLFADHGTVDSVELITDRGTGRSKGFAFIEMSSDTEAAAAIAALDGKDVAGRALKVNEAKPKPAHGAERGGSGRGGR